ncbi:MAG: hypothetical protein Q9227_004771 [Pyrenula ochraceoflavens]
MMGAYSSFVKAQSNQNQSLAGLCKFLLEAPGHEQPCRLGWLDLASTNPKFSYLELSRLAPEIDKFLDSGENSRGNSCENQALRFKSCGQILFVEDLTRQLIETLGSKLNIDPVFFALHLSDDGFNRSSLGALPSARNNRRFINIKYQQVVAMGGLATPITKRIQITRNTNVYRKVTALPSWEDVTIGLIECHFSIHYTSFTNGTWLGIMLVDPPTEASFLFNDEEGKPGILWNNPFLEPYSDVSAGSTQAIRNLRERVSQRGRQSSLEVLKHHWELSRFTTNMSHTVDNEETRILLLSYEPLRIVAREWNNYVAVMRRLVKQYEYSNNEESTFLSKMKKLDSDLNLLQSWRRRTIASLQKIDVVIRFLRSHRGSGGPNDSLDDLLEDYLYLAKNIETYGHRLENMLPVVTSLVQIVDSRRAFAETANISRLTILALIFMPLSYVSSLLSMGNNVAPSRRQFVIYLVVALPLTAVVILIACSPIVRLRAHVGWVCSWRKRFLGRFGPEETL